MSALRSNQSFGDCVESKQNVIENIVTNVKEERSETGIEMLTSEIKLEDFKQEPSSEDESHAGTEEKLMPVQEIYIKCETQNGFDRSACKDPLISQSSISDPDEKKINVENIEPTVSGSVRLLASSDMEWNIEKTTLFIEDYHNSPELWNIKSTVYKDSKLKHGKLKQLASKYDCSVVELKKKIKNLRSAFHRERNKLQRLKKSGSSHKKRKWFAYEMLSFLLDLDVPKKNTSTTSDGEDSEVEDDFGSDTHNIQDTEDTQNIQDTKSTQDIQSTKYTQDLESGNRLSKLSGHIKNKRSNNEAENKIFLSAKKKKWNNMSCTSPSYREKKAYVSLKRAVRTDDCALYGNHVGNELRILTPRAQTIVKHLVNNILFNAAVGKYNVENLSSTSNPQYVDDSIYGSHPSSSLHSEVFVPTTEQQVVVVEVLSDFSNMDSTPQ